MSAKVPRISRPCIYRKIVVKPAPPTKRPARPAPDALFVCRSQILSRAPALLIVTAVLQQSAAMPRAGRSPIGAADPDADHRLLLQHPLGTAACEEAHLNLAYRWFCGLGPDAEVSDHSTFSKSRHGRFRDSDLLPRLFETVLQRCIDEGLVGGRGFAVDASLIQAQRQRSDPRRGRRGPAAGRGPAVPARNISPRWTMALRAASEVTPQFSSPANPPDVGS